MVKISRTITINTNNIIQTYIHTHVTNYNLKQTKSHKQHKFSEKKSNVMTITYSKRRTNKVEIEKRRRIKNTHLSK